MSNEVIPVGQRGMVAQNATDLRMLAEAAVKGGIAPNGMSTERAFAVMGYAMELGVSPFQGLFGIYFPQGGAPTCSAKLMRSLVFSTGEVEDIKEYIEGTGDAKTAYCIIKRKGIPTPFTGKYSVGQARVAGLLGKDNWKKYEDRMLTARALSFCANDGFQDVMKGLYERSEIEDGFSEKPPTETPPHVVKESRPLLKKNPAVEEAKERIILAAAGEPAPAPETTVQATIEAEVDQDLARQKKLVAIGFFMGQGVSERRVLARMDVPDLAGLGDEHMEVLRDIAKEAQRMKKAGEDFKAYLLKEFPEFEEGVF